MNLTDVITGTPVTPEELRAARDRRILKSGSCSPQETAPALWNFP